MQRQIHVTTEKCASKGESVELVMVEKTGMARGGCGAPCNDGATRSALCCSPPATRPRIVRYTKMKNELNLITLN